MMNHVETNALVEKNFVLQIIHAWEVLAPVTVPRTSGQQKTVVQYRNAASFPIKHYHKIKCQDVLFLFISIVLPMDVELSTLAFKEETAIQVMFSVRKLRNVIHCCIHLVDIQIGLKLSF